MNNYKIIIINNSKHEDNPKMKIIIFALAFISLLSFTCLAEGLEMTRLDARVDYDYSTAYKLEQQEKMTRINYASVPLKNDSKVNVELYPGANLTFIITIENSFKDSIFALRDIVAEVTVEGKRGKKFSGMSGGIDLEAGTEEKADVKLNVPFDIDSGTNNVLIKIEGVGKNHTLYKTMLNLKLEILKLSHDIRITKVSLEPATAGCKRNFEISAEVANAGSSSENEIAIEFKSPSLGIESYDKDISLRSSTDDNLDEIIHKKTLYTQAPTFLKAGTYPVFVNLYWQNLIFFDQKIVYLSVKDCVPSSANLNLPDDTKNESSVELLQPAEGANQAKKVKQARTASGMEIMDSPILLSIIIGNAFLITAVGALAVFKFVKKEL